MLSMWDRCHYLKFKSKISKKKKKSSNELLPGQRKCILLTNLHWFAVTVDTCTSYFPNHWIWIAMIWFQRVNNLSFVSFKNSSKRTVDFGLARGLSGAIEAKHRLGMAAANFAGGKWFLWKIFFFSLNENVFYFIRSRTSTTIRNTRINSIQLIYSCTKRKKKN